MAPPHGPVSLQELEQAVLTLEAWKRHGLREEETSPPPPVGEKAPAPTAKS